MVPSGGCARFGTVVCHASRDTESARYNTWWYYTMSFGHGTLRGMCSIRHGSLSRSRDTESARYNTWWYYTISFGHGTLRRMCSIRFGSLSRSARHRIGYGMLRMELSARISAVYAETGMRSYNICIADIITYFPPCRKVLCGMKIEDYVNNTALSDYRQMQFSLWELDGKILELESRRRNSLPPQYRKTDF